MSTPRARKFTRRALVSTAVVGGGLAVASGAAVGSYFYVNRAQSTVDDLDFTNVLPIPPLLEGVPDDSGRRVFDLTLQTGQTSFLPSGNAETWGINGPYLAPTLRAARGDEIAFAIHNELPEETSLHWHGMHLPATMDGGPHQTVAVGATWEPGWTVDQPAATLWYHPHPHGQTGAHVYRGVAGLFLIDEDEPAGRDLPHEYEVDDIPLILQDKNFTDDGDLDLGSGSIVNQVLGSGDFGILGDTILVNGTLNPHLELTRPLVRFRILNASNARFYNLGFADDRAFHLVATDNGLVPGAPVEVTRLQVGPGERVEIVVGFQAGEQVVLRSYAPGTGRRIGGDDTFDLVQFRASAAQDSPAALPADLGALGQAPSVPDDARERRFTLDAHDGINDQGMDMSRIDEVIPAGALEVWNVESSGQPHTFHIHGATFWVLQVGGETPPAHLRGPKDTVFVGPDHAVRLAVQFDTYVDPDVPYMYHCHILRHEDNGMMGQFVVVEPGSEDSVNRTVEAHGHH